MLLSTFNTLKRSSVKLVENKIKNQINYQFNNYLANNSNSLKMFQDRNEKPNGNFALKTANGNGRYNNWNGNGQSSNFSNGGSSFSNGGSRFSANRSMNQRGEDFNSQKPKFGMNNNSRRENDKLNMDSDTEVDPQLANFVTNKNFLDKSYVSKYSPEEIKRFYDDEKITVYGSNDVAPFLSFNDYKWPNLAFNLFRKNNYEKPTTIQSMCWPIALSGKDLIGIAVTGSGKTNAYILPAFIHIENNYQRKGKGPMVIVLAPTRELAQQIDEVVNEFSYISSACVYGGAPRGPQINKIMRERPDIIIATPGRLIDYLKEGIINLNNVSYLVLDEADRMLDMGFEPQIRKIIKRIPARDRQTLMFSATWPKEVRRLAEDFLINPVHVKIGSTELQANTNITQIIDVCKQSDKVDKLFELLDKIMSNKENKTIIFADMKKKVDYLQKMLKVQRYRVAGIHGDKTQTQRNYILKGFKENHFSVLIATDVAARGLGSYNYNYKT